MTQPLPFPTLSPLAPTLTRLLTTAKGTDEGEQTSMASKGKDALCEEEVDSPRIQNLAYAIFGGPSSSEEKDEGKTAEGGESLGHEKLEEESSLALGTDTAEPTQTTGEEMDELGFFLRHLGGGELSEEKASELEDKAEAMGYGLGATLFGGGHKMLMCMPDADESRIVKNITRSIGFPEIEDRLSKIKKQKLS